MGKLFFVLFLLIPGSAIAYNSEEFINRTVEYEIKSDNTHINHYAVSQEKLDIYRNAHPHYNFPKKIKNLNRKQAEQILNYFWDNYRFSDYKYDEIQEKIWDMMIHMPMTELENKINDCIRKYYKFDNDFYTPFGSVASVSLLNSMAPKNIPNFYLILNEIQY